MRRTPATLSFLLLAFVVSAPAQTYTQSAIYSFPASTSLFPNQIIQAGDGNFYGTTQNGGPHNSGILFQVSPSGKFTTIFNFCDQAEGCSNTGGPVTPVTQGGDGNFYGTTFGGGPNDDGIIYKITPSGSFSTLYTFCSQTDCHDGDYPEAGLILGSDGNFYGTTVSGGPNPTVGGGTLYKITPSGTYTVLHNFCGEGGASCTDGSAPLTFVQGSDGNFYGVTNSGGAYAYGTIFKITPAGGFTKLYDFCSPANPCISDESPEPSALVEGTDGNFYGVTGQDGAYGFGSVFRITPSGTFTELYDFCGPSSSSCTDGSLPFSLTAASDGNFYGVTWSGGVLRNAGTFFQFTTAGALTQLLTFCASPNDYGECPDGNIPAASLIQGSDGSFYGATLGGGESDEGVIYSIAATPALAPPVQVTISSPSINRGDSATLNWQVLNAFSTTMRQCYAFINGPSGYGGTWTGLQPGSYNSTTNIYASTTPVTVTPTGAGVYSYALTCGGQESGLATLTVIGDAATTALTASPSPAYIGQTVTLTATASPAGTSGPTPSGSVSFVSFGQVLGSANLNGAGVATFSAPTAGLIAAAYPVTAEYSGDPNYNASSGTATVNLKRIPTLTTLTASPNTVTRPGDVTLTATVSRSLGSGTPGGRVTLSVANTTLGVGILNEAGVVIFTESSKHQPIGTYPIRATYGGDINDAASTSSSVTVKVQ
jgi:uncharacterized repeat protein (TIGR03803 family)